MDDSEKDTFLKWVKSKFLRKSPHEAHVERLSNTEDVDTFVHTYLQNLEAKDLGRFTHKRSTPSFQQHYCERHSKPTGKYKGPQETRANNCPAYVSFRFVFHNGKKAVVIRRNLTHKNHNISDSSEKKISRIHPTLVCYIKELADQGRTVSDIQCKCVEWANSQGKIETNDREFFPRPIDINNIVGRHKTKKRFQKDDMINVCNLCTNTLKNEILFFQTTNLNENGALVIIYQNAEQARRMAVFDNSIVLLDVSYKGISTYGFAVYCILSRGDNNQGLPLAYMITSDPVMANVVLFLNELSSVALRRGHIFQPRTFLVFPSCKESVGILQVFPQSQLVHCWYQVLRDMYSWMNRKDSKIVNLAHAVEMQQLVINYMRQMRLCTTKQDFDSLLLQMESKISSADAVKHIREYWAPIGDKWSYYGRRFFHEDHDTNLLIELFFLGLRYQVLDQQCSQHITDLLLTLHHDMETNTNIAHGTELTNKVLGDDMLRMGVDIIWEDNYRCLIPAQHDDKLSYMVDIITTACSCPRATQKDICKHVHVALVKAAERNINIAEERERLAVEIVKQKRYNWDSDHLEVVGYHGDVNIVSTKDMVCTCTAYSHQVKCVHIHVTEMLCYHWPEHMTVFIPESVNAPKILSNAEIIQHKITEMFNWMSQGQIDLSNNSEEILAHTNLLHATLAKVKYK